MQETTVLFICSRCEPVFGFFCDATGAEPKEKSRLHQPWMTVFLSLSFS